MSEVTQLDQEQEVSQEPRLKTYVLLPHTQPSAPIYIQSGNKSKVRINQLPNWQTLLKYTFTDLKGKNKTIRLKLNTNSIWQEEQVKDGVPANAKFTDAERRATEFINGTLTTNNPTVQSFLENCPHYDGFKGKSFSVKKKYFTLYDKEAEIENDNKLFKLRLKAANKIEALNLEEAQNLLITLHGSFFKVPNKLSLCQNLLVSYMDSSDKAVEDILRESNTIDDEITVLIGRLLEADHLSFTAVENQVAKKKAGKFVGIKALSSKEYSLEQRKEMFKDFLLTDSGKPLLEDLRKDLKSFDKKK
jgi:hypothetical protein